MNEQTKIDESGASAVEYGIMIALVAAVIVMAVAFFGTQTNTLFSEPCEQLATAGRPC